MLQSIYYLLIGKSELFNFIGLDFIDVSFSVLSFLLLPFIFFKLRNKVKFIFSKVSFISVMIIILSLFYLFAPLVTDSNPYFQKNLAVTKLKSPLTNMKFVRTLKVLESKNSFSSFIDAANRTVKKSFDNEIQFFDDIRTNSDVTLIQNRNKVKHKLAALKCEEGKPVIYSQFFLLGTDEYGRDVFARLVYGTRISLTIGLIAVALAFVLGIVLGFIAALKGGIVDIILSRITDAFLTIPSIFFVILILALFGSSLLSVVLVLGFSGWMSLFKVTKGEVLSIKNKDYFVSAKMLGLSNYNLLLKEIIPVMISPIVANIVIQFGNVVLAEAALSYLGLSVSIDYPSWGAMLQSGQSYVSRAWWLIFFPGIILITTLFAINRLGRIFQNYFNPRISL
ncbi:MAG: ABC transporter permease [Bacteroidota bacterium]|nr:ABC transporter permease [Bacteroidota bacterium]